MDFQNQRERSFQARLEKQIRSPSFAVYIFEVDFGFPCWTSNWFNSHPHQPCSGKHCWLQASCCGWIHTGREVSDNVSFFFNVFCTYKTKNISIIKFMIKNINV